jgi:acetylornithine deacetylase
VPAETSPTDTSIASTHAAKRLLGQLVAFDTTSHKTNIPMAKFIRDYLADHGVESHFVPAENGIHTSLFATIGPLSGATADGGIGLSGHMDVVPVTGQTWDTDPFVMVEKGTRLYGRGTCDMKGYLACMLAAVPDFKRRKLRTPIHLIFSYDEEVGCTGVRPMIAELGRTLPKPRMVVVGEPTSMLVVDAHKGPVRWRVELTGRPAHSSMAPLGVNTITYAGRILNELDRIEQELKSAKPNKRFDPPYTTLQVTQIQAGTATNIVPESCWFGWEIRSLPGFDVEALERRVQAFIDTSCLPKMKAVAPEADITLRRSNQIPAFAADAGSEVLSLTLKLAQANETFAVSYATEASLFHAVGSSSVVCGPGDIAQAHGANEWIEIAELEKCMAFMTRLANWAEG